MLHTDLIVFGKGCLCFILSLLYWNLLIAFTHCPQDPNLHTASPEETMTAIFLALISLLIFYKCGIGTLLLVKGVGGLLLTFLIVFLKKFNPFFREQVAVQQFYQPPPYQQQWHQEQNDWEGQINADQDDDVPNYPGT